MGKTETLQSSAINFEEAPFTAFHKRVIGGGMLGQYTDGYILGSIGIAMSLATDQLGLTSYWLGIIGAGSLIGLMVGSFLIGPLADRIGRRLIFLTTMFVFCLASFLQFFVDSASQLLILRLILGLAIGADYAVGITMVSEWTPARSRGRVLSFLMVMWVSGYVSAYLAGFFLQFVGENGWRWILLSSVVPSVVALYVRWGTPESPSWLAGKNRMKEALEIIHKYIGKEYTMFKPSKKSESSGRWRDLFSPKWRTNTMVGSVFFACQVIPYFAISIFLPRLLEALKLDNPYASGIVYNIFLFIGVLFGMWVINKISRRIFLVGSFYICAAALMLMTIWGNMPPLYALGCLSIFSLVISAASVLEFAYPPELFPTELRASGVGFCVGASRIGGAMGTFLLPVVMDAFGTSVALFGCFLSLIIGGIVCQLYAPETNPDFMTEKNSTQGSVPTKA